MDLLNHLIRFLPLLLLILINLTRKIVRPAGWWLASAWNNNETQERINTMTAHTELDLYTKSRQLVRTRALTVINRFM